MVRDINAGRFSSNTSLVLLTHGLSLRVFLMRWFHWTVDEFLNVYNPPNAVPLVRPAPLKLCSLVFVYVQTYRWLFICFFFCGFFFVETKS